MRSDTTAPRPATISVSVDQNAARAAAEAAYVGNVTVVPTASPVSAISPSAAPTVEPTPAAAPKETATATPVAKPNPTSSTPSATPKKAADAAANVTISHYVDKPGSQAAIDTCNLVLWTHSPLWLAGHNWCGYQWMAFVPTGTTVTVTQGLATGTYVVTGHKRLTRQSGALPTLNADLVLQTCVGDGTGLTLLKRTK